MKQVILIFFSALLFTSSCKKREEPAPPTTVSESPSITLSFNNVVNGSAMQLKTENYVNDNGDTFTVNAYKYYISNIKFTKDDGSQFSERESYHLIDEETTSSKTFTIKDLPTGKYIKISFLIGVDSERNVSGAQTGDLDPAKGMFWSWNTGYVMAKFEGYSPQAGQYPNNLGFHIGGINSMRWVTLQLPSPVTIDQNSAKHIYLKSDAAEWFKTPLLIKFAEFSFVANPSTAANNIANNYADMFSIDRVE
ncbi:MAG: hypothetical protein JST70_02820 [Bacteroidetes bacterium]|nr:hypothetical protein [Bacteroidota bacterium]